MERVDVDDDATFVQSDDFVGLRMLEREQGGTDRMHTAPTYVIRVRQCCSTGAGRRNAGDLVSRAGRDQEEHRRCGYRDGDRRCAPGEDSTRRSRQEKERGPHLLLLSRGARIDGKGASELAELFPFGQLMPAGNAVIDVPAEAGRGAFLVPARECSRQRDSGRTATGNG